MCTFAEYIKSVILGKLRWTFDDDASMNKYRIKAPAFLYDNDINGVQEDVSFQLINCGHLFACVFANGISPITNWQTFIY